MKIIYDFIAAIVSYILFSVLFEGMNKSMLKVFVPLQKITRKLKRKRMYEAITYVAFIFIAIEIKDFFKINTIAFVIILSFSFALKDTIFETNTNSSKKKY